MALRLKFSGFRNKSCMSEQLQQIKRQEYKYG